MRRAWRAWTSLLSIREGAESLALIRIGAGICVLYAIVPALLDGAAPILWMGPGDGGYRTPTASHWVAQALGGVSANLTWGVIAVTLLSGAGLIVGLGGRIAPLIAGQGLLFLTRSNPLAGGAYDAMLMNVLWLLVLSRSTATLSVDCRLRTGGWLRECTIPAWPRFLILVQLVLVYGATGIQKVSAHWNPFGDLSALYYILQQPSWQRGDMTWLARVYLLTQCGTLVTWTWEVTAPLLLVVVYYRAATPGGGVLRRAATVIDWRTPFALVGVVMHALVWILMDLGLFSAVSLAMYPCLWTPNEVRALIARRWPSRNRSLARAN